LNNLLNQTGKKIHSPNELNLTWDVDGAIDKIQTQNGGQILKSTAKKRNVSKLDGKVATQHSRKCKKRLPGGEISTPCLPTTAEIMVEKQID
jgi:hypothetical protein